MLKRVFLAAVFACLAVPQVRAHPHVFVDVSLRFEADGQGRITGVEVTWAYDELFSLLILSDHGFDSDGDMALTQDERAALLGFDLQDWPEGFEGALFLEARGARVPLGAPEALSVALEEGKLVTRHRRPVPGARADGLAVRPYDPSYYAALSLGAVSGLPEGCRSEIIPPDIAAADAKVESLGGAGREAVFEEVEVGIYYADTLEVTCASS